MTDWCRGSGTVACISRLVAAWWSDDIGLQGWPVIAGEARSAGERPYARALAQARTPVAGVGAEPGRGIADCFSTSPHATSRQGLGRRIMITERRRARTDQEGD